MRKNPQNIVYDLPACCCVLFSRCDRAGDPLGEEAPGPSISGPPPETVLRRQGRTESGQDWPQGIQVPSSVCSLSQYICATVPER